MRAILRLLWALALPVSIWAHEGEDHGQPTPTAPLASGAPRTSAQTPELEWVAVLEGARLLLYLDRYATNEPLVDAVVELESGAYKATAAQLAPGVYAVPAASLAHPGRHVLTLAVQAGEVSDLLTATLEVSPPPPTGPAPARPPWMAPPVWAAAAVLVALVALFIAWRRRSRRAGA